MLNRPIAILLIVALVAVNFSRFFIYAGFELNKKYIAGNLCENRARPWLHCNGKCFFMKKIKQAQENEKNSQQSQKNLFQQAYVSYSTVVKFHTHLLQVIPVPNNRVLLPQMQFSIFQPPQLG